MNKTIKRFLGILPLAATFCAATSLAADSPVGTWFDQTGEGAIEISDCNGKLCGRIVWLKSERNLETCHLQVIGNVAPVGRARWGGGWIYDPESRNKYDVEITPAGQQKLKVLGYAGSKMFGETMMWTKAPADLKRCGEADPGVVTAQAVPQQSAPSETVSQKPTAAASPVGAVHAARVPVTDDPRPEVAVKGVRRASGQDTVAEAKSERPDRREAVSKKRAKPEQLMRLSELGSDFVALRKSRGVCKLTITEIGKVSFPC